MKHFIKHFSSIVAVLLMTFTFAACSDDDKKDDEPETPKTLNEQLVGTWQETNLDSDESPYILVFYANQTGSVSYTPTGRVTYSEDFKWDTGSDSDGFNYVEILKTSGDDLIKDGYYPLSLIGDDLSFGGLRFVRR